MASLLKVDKLDPQSGTSLEIGTSGDTVTVPTGAGLTVTDEVKTNKVSPATGTAFALGDSGDTFTVPSGATLDISASTLTPPATMPASSGINFTALNATNLGSGTVPTARLGTGTASSSTVLYGDQTYKAEPAGGITGADSWNLTTSFTGSGGGTGNSINANLTQNSHSQVGVPLGSGMTESSGVFTFPSTGYWFIMYEVFSNLVTSGSPTDNAVGMAIQATVNDSTYVTISYGSGIINTNSMSGTCQTSHTIFNLVDVTDVANVKCRFVVEPANASTTIYGTADGFTHMTFIRLGDT